MIYSLSGHLKERYEDFVILDVQGVGYQVFISEMEHSQLPALSEPLSLYTYHHIREDSQQLFGFLTLQNRAFFLALTSVSGVGPKVAIKILSGITATQFIQSIMSEDLATLTSISGVGKKMAERMIVELKDKLPKLFPHSVSPEDATHTAPSPQMGDDYILALQTLGYSKDEIKRAFSESGGQLSEDVPLEKGIKILLKHI